MILRIDGNISRTYCQNLCLIYFPGAKFPLDEGQDASGNTAVISLKEDNGTLYSDVEIITENKSTRGEASYKISDFPTEERARKITVGKAFGIAGNDLLCKRPPWGIMTGVRPVKVAEDMKKRGLTDEEVVKALVNDYGVREDKASLLCRVIKQQEYAKSLATENSVSLYVSIPFCPTRCNYCSFVSFSTPKYLSTLPAYLDKLCLDIKKTCSDINAQGKSIKSVYIGGGTPTILGEEQLRRLIDTVNESVKGHNILEFTVEAGRPDTVTKEKFDIMVSSGVDRTSINPQILDDDVLRVIGRGHTVRDFYNAYEIAKKSGIRSINTDLIAGLPSASEESFCRTVDDIVKLDPENVTVHTYCVKKSATFTSEAYINGDTRGIYSFDGGITGVCVDYAQKTFGENGYSPYYLYRQKNAQGNLENVGFCRDGYEGLYNIFIMEEIQSIAAVGAGAVSKTVGKPGEKIKRIFEPKYTYEYISKE